MITIKIRELFFAALFNSLFVLPFVVSAQNLKIAVLPHGETGQKFYERFRLEIAKQDSLRLIDPDLSFSVLKALNYPNAFNLSLDEAKNLGAAIDCDFFFIVKSETARRSSFQKDFYFEAYANVFLVSARTGRLAAWQSVAENAEKSEDAEKRLLDKTAGITRAFATQIQNAFAAEREERANTGKKPTYLEISDAATEKENIRTPLPYKSLKPTYTEQAARLQVEAAVEAAVELNAKGTIENVEIVRWAGFGLDEETMETIRKMHFRPAVRGDGVAIPVRFVVRYNFRRPRE